MCLCFYFIIETTAVKKLCVKMRGGNFKADGNSASTNQFMDHDDRTHDCFGHWVQTLSVIITHPKGLETLNNI